MTPPSVHPFDLAWEFDEPLSVHLLETDDAAVLFGAGSEAASEELTDRLAGHAVDVVLVEHGDHDHYGGVPALRESFPDAEVAVPAGDVPLLEEAGIDVDVPLDAGERYWGVETIPAPGHTPDNMSYRYGDVLVAGDTVVGADSLFAADGAWSGPFAMILPHYNPDDALARASVSTLLDYDFETVLLSHGRNVVSGGHEAVETLVADLG